MEVLLELTNIIMSQEELKKYSTPAFFFSSFLCVDTVCVFTMEENFDMIFCTDQRGIYEIPLLYGLVYGALDKTVYQKP